LEFANAANLFENVELSRLDPIFFKNSGSAGSTFFFPRDVPAQPVFSSRAKIVRKSRFSVFLAFLG